MFLGLSKAWQQICGLVILVLAARFLSLDDFGVFAIAAALSMILNQWVGVGSYEYVIREVNDDAAPSTAFWFNTLTACAFAGVGFLMAGPAGAIYGSDELPLLIMIMAPLAVPAGWRSVAESLLVRRNQLGLVAGASILQETLALAAGAAALLQGWGVWSLAVHKCVQFILSPILYLVAARWLPRPVWRRQDVKAIFQIGAPLSVYRLLLYVVNYAPDLILGALLTPAAAGVYRIGARIVTAVYAMLIDTFRTRAWARLASAQQSMSTLPAAAASVIGQAFIVCTPAFLGLALTADLTIEVVLGPKWSAATPIVQILSLAAIAGAVGVALEPLAAIHRRMTTLLMFNVVCTLATLPALILPAPFGPTAVAAALGATNVVLSVITLGFLQRVFSVRWDSSLVEVAAAAAGGIVLALGVFAVRGAIDQYAPGSPAWAELAVCAFVGAILYAGALMMIRRLFARRLFASWVS
jgi:O-antigen/teichoic acid export membrane protein